MTEASPNIPTMMKDIHDALDKVKAFIGTDLLEHPLVNSGVLREVLAEYRSMVAKHGEKAINGSMTTELERLSALTEEVGEVAETMSYDQKRASSTRRKELIQVANVCLAWASMLTEPVVVDLHG